MSVDFPSWGLIRTCRSVNSITKAIRRFSTARLLVLNFGNGSIRLRNLKRGWKSLENTSWDTTRRKKYCRIWPKAQQISRRTRKNFTTNTWLSCRGKYKFRLFRKDDGRSINSIRTNEHVSRRAFMFSKKTYSIRRNLTFWLTKIFLIKSNWIRIF